MNTSVIYLTAEGVSISEVTSVIGTGRSHQKSGSLACAQIASSQKALLAMTAGVLNQVIFQKSSAPVSW